MKLRLKPLHRQVVVVTGASSGIGLSTARKAADAGACVVLSARNGEAITRICDDLTRRGARAVGVTADVGQFEDVERLGRIAVESFGRIDTWVNNAGVSIYGRLTQVPHEDHRRLFETNFWGVVHGSEVAIAHMRHSGGALINIGSTLSDLAVPLQGMYSASKHAVQGYTDALRMELEHDRVPISVSLIKPAAVATLYTEHARSYTGFAPRNPPPHYAPSVVADAVLHCALRPTRHVFVGGAAKALSLGGRLIPRLMDKILERTMFQAQQGEAIAPRRRHDSLDEFSDDGFEEGGRAPVVLRHSAYTRASTHPLQLGLLLLGILAATRAWRLWR